MSFGVLSLSHCEAFHFYLGCLLHCKVTRFPFHEMQQQPMYSHFISNISSFHSTRLISSVNWQKMILLHLLLLPVKCLHIQSAHIVWLLGLLFLLLRHCQFQLQINMSFVENYNKTLLRRAVNHKIYSTVHFPWFEFQNEYFISEWCRFESVMAKCTMTRISNLFLHLLLRRNDFFDRKCFFHLKSFQCRTFYGSWASQLYLNTNLGFTVSFGSVEIFPFAEFRRRKDRISVFVLKRD